MKAPFKWHFAFFAGLLGSFVLNLSVNAGGPIDIGDGRWINIGAGLKAAYRATEDGSPNGTEYSKDFDLDDTRLYLSAKVTDLILAEVNTFKAADDDVQLLDAVAKFNFSNQFNIWVGRHIPPGDRINYSGGFFQNSFDFPIIASRYTFQDRIGRDDGISAHGYVLDDKLLYHFGIFEGTDALPNGDDALLYAFRLAYNFWEPDSGGGTYYTSGTYYGDKDILTIGFALNIQEDAFGTNANPEDNVTFNIDLLMEKALSNDGVVTVEAAYYDYDRPGSGFTPGAPIDGDGEAYIIYGGYLFPQEIGWGKLQPHLRYQDFDDQLSQFDIGVNYVIKGHSARISLVYSNIDPEVGSSTSQILIGTQIQF